MFQIPDSWSPTSIDGTDEADFIEGTDGEG